MRIFEQSARGELAQENKMLLNELQTKDTRGEKLIARS